MKYEPRKGEEIQARKKEKKDKVNEKTRRGSTFSLSLAAPVIAVLDVASHHMLSYHIFSFSPASKPHIHYHHSLNDDRHPVFLFGISRESSSSRGENLTLLDHTLALPSQGWRDDWEMR